MYCINLLIVIISLFTITNSTLFGRDTISTDITVNTTLSGDLYVENDVSIYNGATLTIQNGSDVSFKKDKRIRVVSNANLYIYGSNLYSETPPDDPGDGTSGGGFFIQGANAHAYFYDCYFESLGHRCLNGVDTMWTVQILEGGDAYLERDTLKGGIDVDDFFFVKGNGSYLYLKNIFADKVRHGSCLRVEDAGSLVEVEESFLTNGPNNTSGSILDVTGGTIRFLGYKNTVGDCGKSQAKDWWDHIIGGWITDLRHYGYIRQKNGGLVECENVWWKVYPIYGAEHLGYEVDVDDYDNILWSPARAFAPRDGEETPTTSGTISNNELWMTNVSLAGNVTVASGCTLQVLPEATIQFNGYHITTTSGWIVPDGANAVPVMSSYQKAIGLFPDLSSACSWAPSGSFVVIKDTVSCGGMATVTSGRTLTILPGTVINFTNTGAGITITGDWYSNGKLTDLAASGSPITMRASGVASWAGLTIEHYAEVSDDMLEYLNISDASVGITIDNNSGLTIDHCVITDGDVGISLQNNASVTIVSNNIHGNGAEGIIVDNATIDDYSAYNASHENFDLSYAWEVAAYDASISWLINGIRTNTDVYCLYAQNNSYVYSSSSYWNGNTASPLDEVDKDGTSSVVIDFPTSSDPTGFLSKSVVENQDPVMALYHTGTRSMADHDTLSAIAAFTEVLQQHGDHLLARHALRQLRTLFRKSDPQTFIALAAEVARSNELLHGFAEYQVFMGLLDAGAVAQAWELGKKLIDRDSPHKRSALYNLLQLELMTGDKNNLADGYLAALQELQDDTPEPGKPVRTDPLVRSAERLIANRGSIIPSGAIPDVSIAGIDDIIATESNIALTKESAIPATTYLGANYPNPFNPATTIQFGLKEPGIVKIRVYDVLGREIAVLVNAQMPAGNHQIVWNGSMQASGVYFVRMEAADFVQTGKMYLLK